MSKTEERDALLQTLRNYGQRPTTAEDIRKGGDATLTDFLIAAGYRKVEVTNAERDRYRAAIVEALAFEAVLPAIATAPRKILSAALIGAHEHEQK